MPHVVRYAIAVMALALPGLSPAADANALSPAVVHVDLMDPSDGGSIHSMTIRTDVESAPAGPVVFEVSNDSKNLVHEMIVVAVARPDAPLPYDAKTNRVIESKIDDLGEASDLNPGEKKTLRLTLKPGTYDLICNQPGHYHAGMKATLTVHS
jgi:uncharacterized cupredoxin-like copper-binding protein